MHHNVFVENWDLYAQLIMVGLGYGSVGSSAGKNTCWEAVERTNLHAYRRYHLI